MKVGIAVYYLYTVWKESRVTLFHPNLAPAFTENLFSFFIVSSAKLSNFLVLFYKLFHNFDFLRLKN